MLWNYYYILDVLENTEYRNPFLEKFFMLVN